MPISPNTTQNWAYSTGANNNGKASYADPLRKINCKITVSRITYGGTGSSTLLGLAGGETFQLSSLPELTWRKEASYNTQSIIGRASPVVSYSSSKSKTLEIVLHMHSPTHQDLLNNLKATHYLAAALHPRYENTYAPPPICTLNCGVGSPSPNNSPFTFLRFIMTSMSQTFASDSVWDETLMVPRMWDTQISGEVIYNYSSLPGASSVVNGQW
jgi:hypothetical protein